MTNNIFLTGATGNIGTKICQTLQADGVTFTAGVTKTPEVAPPFPFTIMNFGDKDSLLRAFQGVDTLFLLLPIIDSLEKFAQNALEAAKEAGVKHVVRTSAATAHPSSAYKLLQMHGQIDQWLQESGLHYTITKPSSFMQNYINFIGHNIKQGTVYNATGDGKSAWIDVRDIGAANAAILSNPSTHSSKVYTLTGSESFSLAEGVARISKLLNQEIANIPIPHEAALETMKSYGMSEFVVESVGSMEEATKDGKLAEVTTDVGTILGRDPITFAQFVEAHKMAWK